MIRQITVPVSSLAYWGIVAAMLVAFAEFIAFAAYQGALGESIQWLEENVLP